MISTEKGRLYYVCMKIWYVWILNIYDICDVIMPSLNKTNLNELAKPDLDLWVTDQVHVVDMLADWGKYLYQVI